MNILYLGPYRQKSIAGIASLFVLRNLIATPNHKVSARPLYIDNYQSSDIIDQNILSSEKIILDHYDILIQNVYPKDSIKINSITKNIIIPIINEGSLDETTKNKLSEFDMILTDTKLSYNRLSNLDNKITNKVKTYDYDVPIAPTLPDNQFNIGILNQTKKIYFIGNYINNITNIHNLCRSFIKNVSFNECSLVLFLLDMTQQLKNDIDNKISEIYAENNIKYAINRIVIIPIDSTIENIVVAHQTGDILVDLQDDNTNTVNTKIATLLNKPIVSFGIEDHEHALTRNNHIYNDAVGVSSWAIDSKIKRAICDKSYTENLVPFKKQHINKII